MKRSKALRLRSIMEQAADKGLDDTTALEAPELFPAWDPAAEYEAGQRVRYEGTLYRCLQSHTAQEGWTPTAAPSLWAKVLIPEEDTIPEWEQPDSTNGYSVGDKVRHNGKIWFSLIDNNIYEPGPAAWAAWKEITE